MKSDRNKLDHITDKPFKKVKCMICNKGFSTMAIDNRSKICPKCDIEKVENSE
jgi:hypothetical protein